MTDTETLRLVLEEIRGVREALHEHAREEERKDAVLRDDIATLREQVAVNKTRLGALTAGVAAVVSAAISAIAKAFF